MSSRLSRRVGIAKILWWWARMESNHRPSAYKTDALTTELLARTVAIPKLLQFPHEKLSFTLLPI